MTRSAAVVAAVAVFALAGCGGAPGGALDDAAGVPTGQVEPHTRSDAEALLGVPEDELPEDMRVSRRGEETYFLTEDYRVGRMTVELDEVDGGFVVTAATVELPDGPLTVER